MWTIPSLKEPPTEAEDLPAKAMVVKDLAAKGLALKALTMEAFALKALAANQATKNAVGVALAAPAAAVCGVFALMNNVALTGPMPTQTSSRSQSSLKTCLAACISASLESVGEERDFVLFYVLDVTGLMYLSLHSFLNDYVRRATFRTTYTGYALQLNMEPSCPDVLNKNLKNPNVKSSSCEL